MSESWTLMRLLAENTGLHVAVGPACAIVLDVLPTVAQHRSQGPDLSTLMPRVQIAQAIRAVHARQDGASISDEAEHTRYDISPPSPRGSTILGATARSGPAVGALRLSRNRLVMG